MKKTTLCTMALCMLALTACADRMNNGSPGGSAYASGSSGNSSGGASGSAGSGGGASAGSTGSAASRAGAMTGAYTPSQQAQSGYGVVQAIDQMQRQDVGVSAMGAMGAAAAGGSTGAPTDKVYRVTVRMDDGSSQLVVVESAPSYKAGDRVRYSNGTVIAY
ncbi:hypothetical protein [Duganella sp. P38]|uniref:hypothetical protein n=1 Tax=Duganella sp. P38 TaxID=3423949 RepID=UPI003D78F99A